MEANLAEEDPIIETLNYQKTLKYAVKHNGKNMNDVPVFRQWLDLMKSEKGDNGLVFYCVDCQLFFYIHDLNHRFSLSHKDCYTPTSMAQYCEYCGELYMLYSICCLRKGLELIKIEVYNSTAFDCIDYFFLLPFVSLIFYFGMAFQTFFYLRKKRQDINYI